jgi:tRNA threonylcarbamoyladenosine biosynthesis protein TsaE
MCRRETNGPEQTEALAAALAACLQPGMVVLVEGELGTGKTTFVRGACRALGVTALVTSPTFTIGQRYPGRVPVSHIDLFRIEDPSREDPDLLSDYLGPDRIAFVEWRRAAERAIAAVAPIAARVRLAHAGNDRRVVEIKWLVPRDAQRPAAERQGAPSSPRRSGRSPRPPSSPGSSGQPPGTPVPSPGTSRQAPGTPAPSPGSSGPPGTRAQSPGEIA